MSTDTPPVAAPAEMRRHARELAGRAVVRVAAGADRWDVLCGLGLVLLAIGLGAWFGTGVALTMVGGLVLALGVTGASAEARAVARASVEDGPARPVPVRRAVS